MIFFIVRYTSKESIVYALFLSWPSSGFLLIRQPIPSARTQVSLLGVPGELAWEPFAYNAGIIVDMRGINMRDQLSQWGWCIKLSYVE